MENKIQFDPGYAPLVIDSLGQVGYIYYMFNSTSDLKIKRLNFRTISTKLEFHLEKTISFYMGCLLWGVYLSSLNKTQIEGNQLLGEDCKEEEYTSELDFLIDFIENKYPRDTKYFQNRIYEPDKRYLPILKTYKEFLILNKGFTNCSETSDIKIPKSLKTPDETKLAEIKNNIDKAIGEKNLTQLLDCFNLIF